MIEPEVAARRIAAVRRRMLDVGVDVVALTVGAELPWLVGYEAMPLERLTMLVLDDRRATLVVPRLEAPRVDERLGSHGVCEIVTWDETDDPVEIVGRLAADAKVLAIGDHTWARFVLALQTKLDGTAFRPSNEVVGPLRMVKDDAEIGALRDAARVVDAIAHDLRSWSFAGRTESAIQRDIIDAMLEGGHQRANFAIVASGPNAASPHHDAGGREVGVGDIVLCDFGGTMAGYCSDITRMFHVGEPPDEIVDAYEVLSAANQAGVDAAVVGARCEDVDAAARRVISDAGLGDRFLHRVGHGIGTEAHEDPYLVEGNPRPLEAGNVFSIEPGIYVPSRFGMRLEDIVVAAADGPQRLNQADRDLAIVS